MLVSGKIVNVETDTGAPPGICVFLIPRTIVQSEDNLYQPPADVLDSNNLVNTAVAIAHMRFEVWLAGRTGNELKAKPVADMAAERLRDLIGREVTWITWVERVGLEGIFLGKRTIERTLRFSGFNRPEIRVSFGGPTGRSDVPLGIIPLSVAQELSSDDRVKVTGRIASVKDDGATVHVQVTGLQKTTDSDFGHYAK